MAVLFTTDYLLLIENKARFIDYLKQHELLIADSYFNNTS